MTDTLTRKKRQHLQAELQKSGVLPPWAPDLDPHQLDLTALLACATALKKEAKTLLAVMGWPVIQLGFYDWEQPAQHEGKPFQYVIQKSAVLDDSTTDDWDDPKLMKLTATTDAVDMENDLIDLSALKKIKQASIGQTLFLNHKYKVPQNVGGLVEKSRLVRKQIYHPLLDKTGTFNCVELAVRPVPKEHNERGWQACQMVMHGSARVGASITALATKVDQSRPPINRVLDVISIETSLVGLPGNVTAWGMPNQVKKSMIVVPAMPAETPQESTSASPAALEGAPTVITPETVAAAPLITKTAADARPIPQGAIPMSDSVATATPAVAPTNPTVTTTVAEPVAAPLQELMMLQKGYFAEAYANRTANIYFLTSLLADAIDRIEWRAMSQWTEKPLTTDEALIELATALQEFSEKVTEKLTPKWKKEDTTLTKSAESALADPNLRLEANEFLSPLPVVQGVLEKAGKRNSNSDAGLIQSIHDTCTKLEAKCTVQKTAETVLSQLTQPAASTEVETLQKQWSDEKQGLTQSLSKALSLTEDALGEVDTLRQQITRLEAENKLAVELLEEYELQPLAVGT